MIDVLRNAIDSIVANGRKNVTLELLEMYYDGEIFKGYELDDVRAENYMPLEERASGILEALNEIIELEENLNDETNWTPLMMSVMNLDYYLTEYLINHGADPNYWDDREEDIKGAQVLGRRVTNYYLEDVDFRLYVDGLDIKNEIVIQNVFLLVKLLVEKGKLGDFNGMFLAIDAENRIISISSLELKY